MRLRDLPQLKAARYLLVALVASGAVCRFRIGFRFPPRSLVSRLRRAATARNRGRGLCSEPLRIESFWIEFLWAEPLGTNHPTDRHAAAKLRNRTSRMRGVSAAGQCCRQHRLQRGPGDPGLHELSGPDRLLVRQGWRRRREGPAAVHDQQPRPGAGESTDQRGRRAAADDPGAGPRQGLYAIKGIAQKDYDQAVSDQQGADGNYKAAVDAVRIFGKTTAEIEKIVGHIRSIPSWWYRAR